MTGIFWTSLYQIKKESKPICQQQSSLPRAGAEYVYMGAVEIEVGVEEAGEGMKRRGGGKSSDLLCNCYVTEA